MRRFILLLIFLCFTNACYAINWVELKTPKNKTVFIDVDSIKEKENNYFYNIKFINTHTNRPIVLTVQSEKLHPYSARLKTYEVMEYEKLNGDYENISNLMTKNLEMVSYGSIVFTCHKYVKNLKNPTVLPEIILE